MRITVLMEDSAGSERVRAEHGLSLYIETARHVLLMDTGASPLSWENARELGVDPARADTVIISHGHYDHAGGLMSLPNRDAVIWMQRGACGAFYHAERYIGIDPAIAALPQLRLLDGDCRIDEELTLFTHITGRRLWPEGNRLLSERQGGQSVQDSFTHEQCLVIEEDGRRVLVSGCAHNGILNILDRFREQYGGAPDAVFSGFHMMQQTPYTAEQLAAIDETARELAKLPTVFYTGHCTGETALTRMQAILPKRLHRICAGDVIEL